MIIMIVGPIKQIAQVAELSHRVIPRCMVGLFCPKYKWKARRYCAPNVVGVRQEALQTDSANCYCVLNVKTACHSMHVFLPAVVSSVLLFNCENRTFRIQKNVILFNGVSIAFP